MTEKSTVANRESKRKCWLVDVDGTLALKGDRSPYDMTRVLEDKPNRPVITVVRALANLPEAPAIVIVSGRDEAARADTEEWLDKYDVPHSALYLRSPKDFRPDQVIKREILNHLRELGCEVEGVIDDRDKVVAMWRDEGLTCLQAAPGNF